MITDDALQELFELLRIESVSSDGKHPEELKAAAEWLARLVDGRVVEGFGNPIVDGVIPASEAAAPTVLAYGHYDVQAPGDLALWDSPPFEPEVRDGWLYARGASDDKGNFWTLLRAARDLAAEGVLPVNLRVIIDGEEEVGGHSVIHYLATVEEHFDAAVIFDGGMAGPDLPAINLALRGLIGRQVRLVSNAREVHSGIYGGAVANPVHDLMTLLAGLVGREDDLADGIAPVSDEERAGWALLPDGKAMLDEAGATPLADRAAAEFYERTWTRPSITVHSISSGDPTLHKTSIGSEALASLSVRLAPGQDAEAMDAQLERMLRAACPPHAEIELRQWPPGSPSYIAPDHPVIEMAAAAIETATGVAPVLIRSGGSIPVMAALLERGTPTVLSGFASGEDNMHSPNERMRLRNMEWGIAAARELLTRLGGLQPG